MPEQEMKRLNSLDDLQNGSNLKITEVSIEGFGIVQIRMISGSERDCYAAECQDKVKGTGDDSTITGEDQSFLKLLLLRMCIVDEKGNNIFTKDNIDQLNNKMDGVSVEKIYKECTKFNGISDKDAEQAEKNSGSDQSDNSGSD